MQWLIKKNLTNSCTTRGRSVRCVLIWSTVCVLLLLLFLFSSPFASAENHTQCIRLRCALSNFEENDKIDMNKRKCACVNNFPNTFNDAMELYYVLYTGVLYSTVCLDGLQNIEVHYSASRSLFSFSIFDCNVLLNVGTRTFIEHFCPIQQRGFFF